MTPLAWTCAYLLGAIITYGICTDHPKWFNVDELTDDIRATHPNATEQQLQHATKKGHKAICQLVAVAWPIAAVALTVAGAYDLAAAGADRLARRRRNKR